jgi:hypothetical protein
MIGVSDAGKANDQHQQNQTQSQRPGTDEQ